MPLIITLSSGRQHIIKGEKWKPFWDGLGPLGATVGEMLNDHPLLIIKSQVATIEEIRNDEWNAAIAKQEAQAKAARKLGARFRRLFRRKR